MPSSGMLYKSELGSTVQLMETGDWGGVRRLIHMNPEFACRRGEAISEMLYRYACGTRDIEFRNLNIDQLDILLSLNKKGSRLDRRRPLVSYVARFVYGMGGYFVDFPDIPSSRDDGDNLREAEINARRVLADYITFCLNLDRDLPEPKYCIRKGLKTIKQRRISVNLDDLVKAEAAS